MAEFYPRVFVPSGQFTQVMGLVSPSSAGEAAGGQAPSALSHLADFDPRVRFASAGAANRSFTWSFIHASSQDRRVNAVASLLFFASSQTLSFQLRQANSSVLETVGVSHGGVSGPASLQVTPTTRLRTPRSVRWQLSQPANRRSVVGFVEPGQVQQLGDDPYGFERRATNLPVVVDPFGAPVARGQYGRWRWQLVSASPADVSLLYDWQSAGSVLVEVTRGDWRMGRLFVTGVTRTGERDDVTFEFVERLLGASF